MHRNLKHTVARTVMALGSVMLFALSAQAETPPQALQAAPAQDEAKAAPAEAVPMFDAKQSIAAISQPSELMLAIANNDVLALSKAIEAGTSVNVPSNEGVHPVLQAAAYANEDVFKRLIAADMDISKQDSKGRNAVHLLAMRGALEPLKLLLILKPDLAQKVDAEGWTPLLIAYANGHFAVAEFLLNDHLENINRLDEAGVPLVFHFVKQTDAPKAITHMIERKLNVFKRNKEGQTLHEVAALAGHTLSAKIIEAHYELMIQLYQQKLKQGSGK